MGRRLILPVCLFLGTFLQGKGQDNPACGTEACDVPDCYCPTTTIPKDLVADNIPQMILFSFNGPVKSKHGDVLKGLFNRKRRNPNGTPIRMTLFVSDDRETTDYCTVNGLWAAGHEVGSFSVNRRNPVSWWATASEADWDKQIESQKQYIFGNGSIPMDQIVGFRSPHLQTGGNAQYKFAVEREYVYDSSIVLPVLVPRVWPYTMDYPTSFPCSSPPCPDGSFPGLWQVPIQPLLDRGGMPCIYLDDCVNKPRNADEVFNILFENFHTGFLTNRAPLMINLLEYQTWFKQNPWALEGVNKFIDEVLSMGGDDVWFVSYNDLVGWMKSPTKLGTIRYFKPFERTKQAAAECEEKRGQSQVDGRWFLFVEVVLCVVAFIWLYAKENS